MNKKGVVYAFFANLLKEYEEKSSFEDAVVNAVQVANAEININHSSTTIEFDIDMVYDVEGLKLNYEKLDEIIKKYTEAHEGKRNLRFNVKIQI